MKPALLIFAIAAFASGALVAAGPAHSAGARPIKAKFNCDKGPSLTVVFKGRKATVTPKGNETVTLTQGLAADGFLYTKGKYKLRGRGDWVRWTTGRGRPLSCYAQD